MGREGKGVRQVTAKSFQIEFVYDGHRCRERIAFNPATTRPEIARKQIERHREAILHAINADTFNYLATFPNSKTAKKLANAAVELTVGVWLNRWIDKKEQHIKASTYQGYSKAIKQIKAALGNIKLEELKRKDVKHWCESLTASNKTIANLVSPLRDALTEAVHEELIPENPLSDFTFKRNEPPKESDVDPFNQSEQEAIINAAKDSNISNLFRFAFWSGLRTSEIVALEWRDIDVDRCIISVNRAKTQHATKPESTKTKAGNREVMLLPPAKAALIAQWKLSGKHKNVFLNPHDSKPWKGDLPIRRVWMLILKRAGVRYRRPYQTRHTYASMMLSAGEPLAWVSNQLGHSSVIQTANVYATWIPNSNPTAGMKAVEMFSRGKK